MRSAMATAGAAGRTTPFSPPRRPLTTLENNVARLAQTGESLVLDPPMNKDGTRAAVVREWTPHSAMLDARDSGAAVSVDLQVRMGG